MSQAEQLTNLQRRLGSARELTDVLVLEALEACSLIPFAALPKKYVLTELCSLAAWEQAAIWVLVRSLPNWTLELRFNERDSTARLLSPHVPPFTVEVTHNRAGTAILCSMVQAILVLSNFGLDERAR